MRNLVPKLFIVVLGVLVSVVSCKPESESSTLSPSNIDSTITFQCDSLTSIAIELIKVDSAEFMKGSGLYQKQFHFYQIETNDTMVNPFPFQIEVHDSLEIEYVWKSRGLDTIFTADDIDKFYLTNSPIETECFPQYNFISKDSIQKSRELYYKGDRKTKFDKYFTLSRPLISKNGRYMLIEFDQRCFGWCGSGHTFLFTKTQKGWEKLWSITRWIS